MLKHTAFRFRIYPNEEQQVLISKTIGCSRFVYNHFLDAWQTLYETTGSGLSYNKCSAILSGIKQQDDQICYKVDWYGKTLVVIDQAYPSRQLCHVCGHKNPQVKDLSVRNGLAKLAIRIMIEI